MLEHAKCVLHTCSAESCYAHLEIECQNGIFKLKTEAYDVVFFCWKCTWDTYGNTLVSYVRLLSGGLQAKWRHVQQEMHTC